MDRRLKPYARKRRFKKTPEPSNLSTTVSTKDILRYVVQEHHASHLHYDFRLEWEGVLKSWAIPKGPSMDSKQKRLAVQTEDHPVDYAYFEGVIPKGEYGAGEVFRWDSGSWTPLHDPEQGFKKGHLDFELNGDKLKGKFHLIRTPKKAKAPQWLLIKSKDSLAKDSVACKQQPIQFTEPQLVSMVNVPPSGNNWVHEIKYDGYRTQIIKSHNTIRLVTRNGFDWTNRYQPFSDLFLDLPVEHAVLDGEMVWQNPSGVISFQNLQNALKTKKRDHFIFWAFDLLFYEDQDFRSLPLIARKDRLKKLISRFAHHQIRYAEHFRVAGKELFSAACELGMEGIVSKKVDATYTSGRNGDWVKTKCVQRQEFVIGGFTTPHGHQQGLGSLLLGVYQNQKLKYVGRCGTGFNQKTLRALTQKLTKTKMDDSPFSIKSPKGKEINFVLPNLVCEVSFAQWTKDGMLRGALFQGLREDKSATDVVSERNPQTSPEAPSVHISHPKRIIFKEEQITKKEVVDYYSSISKWILPHIAYRPLSLLRCPDLKKCFFSKHFNPIPEHIVEIHATGPKSKQPYFTINSIQGLFMLIQMGTIEIHPWNCHSEEIDKPNQIVMDFDPDPSVPFDVVKDAAKELRTILKQLGLKSYLKTTGGKGLHIQFPFTPRYSWDDVKTFSKTLCLEMESRHPDLYTTNIRKNARAHKIFLDYLRNGYGATAIAPYCLRARETTSVALPLTWEQLGKIKSSNQFSMKKVLHMLSKRASDPWKDYFTLRQSIELL